MKKLNFINTEKGMILIVFLQMVSFGLNMVSLYEIAKSENRKFGFYWNWYDRIAVTPLM